MWCYTGGSWCRLRRELARQEGCWALVTGDSLGQVASQTAENLVVVENAAEIPLLRPLIGMDKIEITEQAQQIGSFTHPSNPIRIAANCSSPSIQAPELNWRISSASNEGWKISAFVKRGVEKARELTTFTFPSSPDPARPLPQETEVHHRRAPLPSAAIATNRESWSWARRAIQTPVLVWCLHRRLQPPLAMVLFEISAFEIGHQPAAG